MVFHFFSPQDFAQGGFGFSFLFTLVLCSGRVWFFNGNFSTEFFKGNFSKRFFVFDGNVSTECFPKGFFFVFHGDVSVDLSQREFLFFNWKVQVDLSQIEFLFFNWKVQVDLSQKEFLFVNWKVQRIFLKSNFCLEGHSVFLRSCQRSINFNQIVLANNIEGI